jgi:hypothetical protein
LHEAALVGAQVKVGDVLGSFDANGLYAASPRETSEVDLEEDLFGAIRVIDRGQVALLLPLVETRRGVPGISELGGGIGDVTVSLRYDFTLAGASKLVPGVAALGGVTLPTGKPPDASGLGRLATGATGIGAWQFNVGAAVEQAFGPWLVGVSAFVAQRTARTVGTGPIAVHERLGAQWSALAAWAYVFPSDAALAVSFLYTIEGDATINGAEAGGSGRRLPTLTLSGVYPVGDSLRLQGALFDNLPIGQLGLNQPAAAGLLATVVRSWM